ncbi:hypothetical protein QTP70_006979 [Hemibagrus guttatus]|uniref:Murine leukemia virus integrase C-terminal domain-containing protein n=1 Tax=Hemibagrus guttatus TaxID=175788 RepID=A0AAE0QZT7_9TELE|nr:hypothetical protein QTP70_006979 [Hemibagrus guttatus]
MKKVHRVAEYCHLISISTAGPSSPTWAQRGLWRADGTPVTHDSQQVKGATEGRISEIDKELRTMQPEDCVYVKVFKRKWNEPRRVGPLKFVFATPTALNVEGKNAWFHLNHLSQAQWGDTRHSKIRCYENSTGGDEVRPRLHHDHQSSKYAAPCIPMHTGPEGP